MTNKTHSFNSDAYYDKAFWFTKAFLKIIAQRILNKQNVTKSFQLAENFQF